MDLGDYTRDEFLVVPSVVEALGVTKPALVQSMYIFKTLFGPSPHLHAPLMQMEDLLQSCGGLGALEVGRNACWQQR